MPEDKIRVYKTRFAGWQYHCRGCGDWHTYDSWTTAYSQAFSHLLRHQARIRNARLGLRAIADRPQA